MESDKKSKKKPSKIEEMTKEQIRQAILKKRECNTRSQYIVESLLEKGITAEYLLKCLPEINQSHFDDVIEERSILLKCGYPICENMLVVENIPKQKYRISIKTNKVYDISIRKHFCSNSCYKSAMHLKKQMLTSPLWFREYEEIPVFNLLPADTQGCMGIEVDVALIDQIKPKTSFTSINDFTTASFNDITDDSNNVKEKNDAPDFNVTDKIDINADFSLETKSELKAENIVKEKEALTNNPNDITIEKSKVPDETISFKVEKSIAIKKPARNPMNIVGEIIEKPEKKIDPIILNAPTVLNKENTTNKQERKRNVSKKQPIIIDLTLEVEKRLAEWFTLDTLLFLFGEEKVKEMVADKEVAVKQYLNNYTQSIFYNSNAYDQYQALCRKLNMLELEERRHDSETLQRESKPLPDYKVIEEESKKMHLKVKAYLAGEMVIPELETDDTINDDDEENITFLPLIDKKAQNALRRKIIGDQLNKTLPDLLRSIKLDNQTITSDIKLLVNTFKLKPNNIMFKPIQWTLIAIIFIKLLSLRDEKLRYQLDTPITYQNMQLLLLSYKQDGYYLNRLISWLTQIDRLLDSNETELST